jgi:ubiquinone/menaquinone biosynthesis C-methylase UbiE
MQHRDHVHLLRSAIPETGGTWADLGSGGGAFTLALADLIGPQGVIYSVDQDRHALQTQARALHAQFPAVAVTYVTGDFTQPLDLPPLDGVVMANSLHFVEPSRKLPVVKLIKTLLRLNGRLIVVEYNTDTSNAWVPYPFTYPHWETLARAAGFAHTEQLATAAAGQSPHGFYSAQSW